MEEIIESTFALLSLHPEHGMSAHGSEKILEPVHFLSLLDIKANWFKRWMVRLAHPSNITVLFNLRLKGPFFSL